MKFGGLHSTAVPFTIPIGYVREDLFLYTGFTTPVPFDALGSRVQPGRLLWEAKPSDKHSTEPGPQVSVARQRYTC